MEDVLIFQVPPTSFLSIVASWGKEQKILQLKMKNTSKEGNFYKQKKTDDLFFPISTLGLRTSAENAFSEASELICLQIIFLPFIYI